MKFFSQRHSDKIENGELSLFLSKDLRKKLIDCMHRNNIWNNWDMDGSMFHFVLKRGLLELYGGTSFKLHRDGKLSETGELDDFLAETGPERVFDALEMYSIIMRHPEFRERFQDQCNRVFEEEKSPFRFAEGYIIRFRSNPVHARIKGIVSGPGKGGRLERALRFFFFI
ncbi:MAG: hypothetical protein WBB84_00165 [Candidatus Omnitrophota bacterium]